MTTKTKSQQGKSNRRKGHNWERKVARMLNSKRNLQYQDPDGGDVVHERFHIECKCSKRPSPLRALKQAIEDSEGTELIPIAVVKKDREKPTVTMLLDDFMKLIEED